MKNKEIKLETNQVNYQETMSISKRIQLFIVRNFSWFLAIGVFILLGIVRTTFLRINTISYMLYISSLTVAELEFGVQNSEKEEQNRIALLKFLSIFNILNFDDQMR